MLMLQVKSLLEAYGPDVEQSVLAQMTGFYLARHDAAIRGKAMLNFIRETKIATRVHVLQLAKLPNFKDWE